VHAASLRHLWQEINEQCHSGHWWQDRAERRITAMTALIILLLLAGAVVVFTVAIGSLVDLLRHDRPRPVHHASRVPRSHPADEFDPYSQRFGRHAA
jgi:hypothetical protein